MNFQNMSIVSFLLVLAVGLRVVDSLKCYECGVFIPTSVSPCYNLTHGHLKVCEHAQCSKYVGLSAVVYGCEKNCEERRHGAFDAYCCSEDQCNAASSPLPKTFRLLSAVSAAISLLVVISLLPALLFTEHTSFFI